MWASRGAETGRGLSAGFRLCGWLPGAVEGHCVGSAEISQRHSFRHHRGSSASDLTQPGDPEEFMWESYSERKEGKKQAGLLSRVVNSDRCPVSLVLFHLQDLSSTGG
ncbi:hypothetical protein C0J45_20535 [Silurus meridionalis]|nr:hypothetical protein C0J45_20535 [Silurus meridionalis]